MENNTSWCQSVTGVVIKDGKVLLARHTYGGGAGKLIVPGGYIQFGESPEEALKREYLEETNVEVEPKKLIGIRFNTKDWYVAFLAEYISGEAASDNDENSEVVWMDINEALNRDDVPGMTKKLIECALKAENGFNMLDYEGSGGEKKNHFYGVE